jgi:putative ABC transport system permease protein
LGWLCGHGGCWALSPWIEDQTGVAIGPLSLLTLPLDMAIIPALMLLAVAVGIWPAITAYQTDVAKSLGK